MKKKRKEGVDTGNLKKEKAQEKREKHSEMTIHQNSSKTTLYRGKLEGKRVIREIFQKGKDSKENGHSWLDRNQNNEEVILQVGTRKKDYIKRARNIQEESRRRGARRDI